MHKSRKTMVLLLLLLLLLVVVVEVSVFGRVGVGGCFQHFPNMDTDTLKVSMDNIYFSSMSVLLILSEYVAFI